MHQGCTGLKPRQQAGPRPGDTRDLALAAHPHPPPTSLYAVLMCMCPSCRAALPQPLLHRLQPTRPLHQGLAPLGTGPSWDWPRLGRAPLGTGPSWDLPRLGLAPLGTCPAWDWPLLGLAPLGTCPSWDWPRLGLAPLGTCPSWDLPRLGLAPLGTGPDTFKMTKCGQCTDVYDIRSQHVHCTKEAGEHKTPAPHA
eukprot:161880-Chlamydomonas_euryale.AAC.3